MATSDKAPAGLGKKEAFWVRCGDCRHPFIAFYLPMRLDLISRYRHLCCPKCASKNVLCGKRELKKAEGK